MSRPKEALQGKETFLNLPEIYVDVAHEDGTDTTELDAVATLEAGQKELQNTLRHAKGHFVFNE